MDACIAHKRHTNSSTSALLKLPARLKEKIYAYVLVMDRPIELNKKSVQRYRSLLKVCAQIRRKATPIFYANNTFRLDNIFSEAINFLKHARGRIPKLIISFEVAPNKFKQSEREHHIDHIQRVPRLAEFLLIWDVNPKAVVVEKPRPRYATDTARDYLYVSHACNEFERVFRDLASPHREQDVLAMKAKVRQLADDMDITKPTASGVKTKGLGVRSEGAAVSNTRENGPSALGDGTATNTEGKNSKKNKKKARAKKMNGHARVEGAGVEFSRIIDVDKIPHVY